MAGSMGGQLKTGRTLDYENADDRKMSSLYMTLLQRLGMPLNEFGNSQQALSGI
jgi:hypothetical protein